MIMRAIGTRRGSNSKAEGLPINLGFPLRDVLRQSPTHHTLTGL